MPRGQINPNEQQIRPPFQDNLIDEKFIEQPQDHIHHFGNELKESNTSMTKDEHESFVLQEEEDDQGVVEEESKDYHKAYLNDMMDLQNQYNLRRKNMVVDPPKKAPEGQASTSQLAKNQLRREMVQQKLAEKDIPKASPYKEKELPKESIPKEKDLQKEEIKKDLITVERLVPPFSLQN